MKVSVVLCTYNRAQSLSDALESVAAQTLPEPLEWEVVVVDNNSRDQTREVVDDFCRRYPRRFRYVFEPNQGLSHARNAGIREARGDVLAFMDDDVTVEPRWLDNLTAPLRDGEWAGSGGMTLPAGPFTPPHWLAPDGPYNMLGVLCAYFNPGGEARELEEAPYGTNMAFRKQMFEKYGGFRIDLSRCAGNTMSNEDTEFGRRLMKAGERLRYEPSAVVRHPVPVDRVTKKYFLAFWFDYGRAFVREWGPKPTVLGIPRPYLNILKLGTVVMAQKVGQWVLSFNPQRRFYHKCRVWMIAGQIREYYRYARGIDGPAAHSVSEPLSLDHGGGRS
jgi:glycosyltransferase involved in cell wall biosynthesis